MANRKLASATLFLGAFEAFLYGEQKVGKCHLVFRRVRKIGKSYYYLRHFCLPVRSSAWNISAPTGRIFMKFEIRIFLENLSKKSSFIKIRQE